MLEGLSFYHFHNKMGFWGIPNLSVETTNNVNQKIWIRHDKFGNRNSFNYSSINDGVAIFGGSNSWGAGISNKETFAEILGKSLKIQFVNFGHCSLGLDQIYIAMQYWILKLGKPKVVILEQHPWVLHRVLRKYFERYPKPYFSLEKNKIVLNKLHPAYNFKIVRYLKKQYEVFNQKLSNFESEIDLSNYKNPNFDPMYQIWALDYYSAMYEMVEQIVKKITIFLTENKIHLIWVVTPDKNMYAHSPITELVRFDLPTSIFTEILNKTRSSYIQVDPSFGRNYKNYLFADGHLNSNGHQYIANLLKVKIRESEILEKI